MNRRISLAPAYAAIIAANALPIYGAIIGKLFFFQILYLYWFESVLLIVFDSIRIGMARGKIVDGVATVSDKFLVPDVKVFSGWGKVKMICSFVFVKFAILCFYLIFIVAFIGFMLTGKEHRSDMLRTLIFRDAFFNTAVWLFVISMVIQLLGGFILNGRYKQMSPLNYRAVFDRRTIMIHIMTVMMVFVHQFLFEGRTYAAKGEIAYITIFMFVKALMDISAYRAEQLRSTEGMVMI